VLITTYQEIIHEMEFQSHDIDSTTGGWNKIPTNDHLTRHDPNETPTVNSTNPHYHPTSTTTNHHSVLDTTVDKAKTDLKKGQQHAEDIITKSKRLLQQQWEQTRHSINHLQKRIKEMTPKQATHVCIISSGTSTCPCRSCFNGNQNAPLPIDRLRGQSRSFGVMLEPRYIFGAGSLDQ